MARCLPSTAAAPRTGIAFFVSGAWLVVANRQRITRSLTHSFARLKNASGTKLQVNGAAYGSGIYLSPAASVSFGYSRMYGHGARANAASTSTNRFLVSSSVHCIAICEVINTNDIKKSGDIWVQPHEDHVLTRFLYVFLFLSFALRISQTCVTALCTSHPTPAMPRRTTAQRRSLMLSFAPPWRHTANSTARSRVCFIFVL